MTAAEPPHRTAVPAEVTRRRARACAQPRRVPSCAPPARRCGDARQRARSPKRRRSRSPTTACAYAVMLATPADLEDFAVGFSLTEGIVAGRRRDRGARGRRRPSRASSCACGSRRERADSVTQRQRRLAGPSGCGLCGLESLADAVRTPPQHRIGARFDAAASTPPWRRSPARAEAQPADARGARGGLLAPAARARRAARGCRPAQRARQAGRRAGARRHGAVREGVLLLSSRISVEMVQKAAMLGAPVVVAVSAPTALAVRLADRPASR